MKVWWQNFVPPGPSFTDNVGCGTELVREILSFRLPDTYRTSPKRPIKPRTNLTLFKEKYALRFMVSRQGKSLPEPRQTAGTRMRSLRQTGFPWITHRIPIIQARKTRQAVASERGPIPRTAADGTRCDLSQVLYSGSGLAPCRQPQPGSVRIQRSQGAHRLHREARHFPARTGDRIR